MRVQGFIWLTMLLATQAFSADWATWRGPNANGISDETGWNAKALKSNTKPVWTVELGVGHSTACVKDGRLYTMGNVEDKDIVYCLDAKTGEELWTYSYDCKKGNFSGPRATPVYDEGILYTFSRNGLLLALDPDSGKLKWKLDVLQKTGVKNIKWGLSSSPVIDGDLILLNVGKAGVAVNKKTKSIEWKSDGSASYASAVPFDQGSTHYAAFFSGKDLFIVNRKTGEQIASYGWVNKYEINGADPMIIGDQIFITAAYKNGCAMLNFSDDELSLEWKSDVLNSQFSSCIYLDGYIYGIDGAARKNDGILRCIDAKDGSVEWSKQLGFGSLICADGQLIVMTEEGMMYIVKASPKKFSQTAKVDTGLPKLCWTPPVLANGFIYCRNDKGTMVAFDVSK